jgi:hypothetical protein
MLGCYVVVMRRPVLALPVVPAAAATTDPAPRVAGTGVGRRRDVLFGIVFAALVVGACALDTDTCG